MKNTVSLPPNGLRWLLLAGIIYVLYHAYTNATTNPCISPDGHRADKLDYIRDLPAGCYK